MNKKIIYGLILILVTAIFVIQNYEKVNFNFFVFQVNIPLALIILLSFVIGVILGLIISIGKKNKKSELVDKKQE